MISTADAFAALQGLLGARVFARMLATSSGAPVRVEQAAPAGETVVAVLPVLNERDRLDGALAGLVAQPGALTGIVVVDGGSTDGTQNLVRAYAARDRRIALIDAAPVPPGWNGKAWNLARGLAAADPTARWLLTLDADVRPGPHLIASLLSHARRTGLDAFSAAPRFRLSGAAEAVIHPALLATLVYRYGLPGSESRRPERTLANGQCFLARRDLLATTRAFDYARASRCDDVTVARELVRSGARVGFFEGGALATVEMYASAGDAWRNWPRSLALRDADSRLPHVLLGLAEVGLVQALPLAVVLIAFACRARRDSFFFRINAALACARLGVLAGTRRAYARPGPAFWFAALADVPAAVRLVDATFATSHTWRGRPLVRDTALR